MFYKELLSTAAVVLTLVAFYPYLRGILQGAIKPHVFSWVIWGASTCVIFLAQLDARGGVGSWSIGLSGGITLLVAVLAYLKRADVAITRSDWGFLISALSALPLWFFTADPTWAVVLLTWVNLLGFGPTVTKVYVAPDSEPPMFFALFAVRNGLVIVALESYSVATLFFPVAMTVAYVLVVGLILYRRRASRQINSLDRHK